MSVADLLRKVVILNDSFPTHWKRVSAEPNSIRTSIEYTLSGSLPLSADLCDDACPDSTAKETVYLWVSRRDPIPVIFIGNIA